MSIYSRPANAPREATSTLVPVRTTRGVLGRMTSWPRKFMETAFPIGEGGQGQGLLDTKGQAPHPRGVQDPGQGIHGGPDPADGHGRTARARVGRGDPSPRGPDRPDPRRALPS